MGELNRVKRKQALTGHILAGGWPEEGKRVLAAGLARDRAWRHAGSIRINTRGMDLAPAGWRFPRYRGHRIVSTR